MSDARITGAIAGEAGNISGLEAALAERAQKLAGERLASGHQARERILAEIGQRLHIDEQREVLSAKAQAERVYQQRVQAAELDLRAGLDRLRWELVHAVLARLPARLEEQAADEPGYLPLLLAYLGEAAQAIERDELVAQLNRRDWQRFRDSWEELARQSAPGKRLTLSPETLNSIGGVLVTSADGNIRFDNTFEGRMERLDEALHGTVAERLEPSPSPQPSPQSSGGTTDKTTSHLTNPAKDAGQVIGYSHSTKPASGQVAGYPASGRGGEREKQLLIPGGEGDKVSLRDAPVNEMPHG